LDRQTSDPFQRLVTALKRLPGVGEKNAIRLAHHLMKEPPGTARELADAIVCLTELSRPCSLCFAPSLSEKCRLCSDPRRDAATVCVVENVPDILAIERSGNYQGLYHVLGGVLSPLDGIGPEKLRIAELRDRVERGGISEVILAVNPSTEGETTNAYISDLLRDLDAKITRIALGIPVGGELEYSDKMTVAHAMSGRRKIS